MRSFVFSLLLLVALGISVLQTGAQQQIGPDQIRTLPQCPDSAGQHLNFDSSANSFSCGSTDSHPGTVTSVGAAPPLSSTGGTSPTLSIGNVIDLPLGGTNQSSWTAARCVRVNDTGTALEASASDCSTGGGGPSPPPGGALLGGMGNPGWSTTNFTPAPFNTNISGGGTTNWFLSQGGFLRTACVFTNTVPAGMLAFFGHKLANNATSTLYNYVGLKSGDPKGSYCSSESLPSVRAEEFDNYQFNYNLRHSPTVAADVSTWSAEYPTDNGAILLGGRATTCGANSTCYHSVFSQENSGSTTETDQQWPVAVAGTLQRFWIAGTGAQSSGTCGLTIRLDNGFGPASTSLSITVPASAFIGFRHDLANTATVQPGDLIDLAQTNSVGVTSCQINGWGVELLPTNGGDRLIGGSFDGLEFGTSDRFNAPMSSHTNVVELRTEMAMPWNNGGTVSNCYLRIASDSTGGTFTWALRKNEDDTALAGTGVSGTLSDTSNSSTFVQKDRYDFRATKTGGGTIRLAGWSCKVVPN